MAIAYKGQVFDTLRLLVKCPKKNIAKTEVLVAPYALLRAMEAAGESTQEGMIGEALVIDEMVYYYVDDEIFNKGDPIEIAKNLDEEFTLIKVL
jgi:hypothetical protein